MATTGETTKGKPALATTVVGLDIYHVTVGRETTTIIATATAMLGIGGHLIITTMGIIIIVLEIGTNSTIITTTMKGNVSFATGLDILPHNAHKRIPTIIPIGIGETIAKHLLAANPAHKTNG